MRNLNVNKLFSAGVALSFLFAGCGTDDGGAAGEGKPDETGAAADKLANGKADAWDWRNNPDGLRVEMKYKLAELHGAGMQDNLSAEPTNAAWPDTYWPTYADSVNARWQTTADAARNLSPVEKYDAAFNGWDPSTVDGLRPFDARNCDPTSWDNEYYGKLGPAAKYVSDSKGNKKTRDAAIAGDLDNSCNAKPESSCVTACADSDDRTRCENRCDRGGVETWWGLCHAWAPAALLEKEPLHAVTYNGVTFDIADMKALYAVIYDRSSSALVGNRCNDFNVDRDEVTGRITDPGCRDFNAGALHVSMVNLIALQGKGFVEDRTFDYEVWNQPVKGYDITLMDEISVADAHALLNVDAANPPADCAGRNPANGEYCYNDKAAKLYKVNATLHWITESHAENFPTGATNLDRYSRTDRYTYILEVDSNDEVIGGEYYGSSITNHPDFIWLPFNARGGNPNVSIEKVKMLGRLSQTPADNGGGDEPTEDVISAESGAVGAAIPDKVAAGIDNTVTVNDGATVTTAKVSVDITHTYIGDLVVKLTSPTGQTWTLHSKEGGSADDLKKTYTLDDVQGAINGGWVLNVADTYAQDTGTLNSWKIDFLVGGGGENPDSTVTVVSGAGGDIPDNSADGTSFDATSNATGTVRKLELTVDIEHTYISDLQVELVKGAVSKVVHNRAGGSDDNIKRTFNVSEFAGAEASGTWTLKVRDLARLDKGKLNSWKLKITH